MPLISLRKDGGEAEFWVSGSRSCALEEQWSDTLTSDQQKVADLCWKEEETMSLTLS